MREQAMETSRVQQRENANRIIEFSQKNAKLSSEHSAKNDEIFALKRARDESLAAQQEAQKERDDLKAQLHLHACTSSGKSRISTRRLLLVLNPTKLRWRSYDKN